MLVCGIDPGTEPRLALVDSKLGWLDVADRDLTSARISDTKRRPVGELICEVLRGWIALHDLREVAIEKVSTMPDQGIASNAELVGSMHLCIGISIGLGLRVTELTPPVWKRKMKLLTLDKDASRLLALRRYPNRADWLKRALDHNRADAALIGQTWLDMQHD